MSEMTIRVTSSAVNVAGTGFGQQPDLGAPSYLDVVVTGSTDPNLIDGTYDAYCLNPDFLILFSPTHTALTPIAAKSRATTPTPVSSARNPRPDSADQLAVGTEFHL